MIKLLRITSRFIRAVLNQNNTRKLCGAYEYNSVKLKRFILPCRALATHQLFYYTCSDKKSNATEIVYLPVAFCFRTKLTIGKCANSVATPGICNKLQHNKIILKFHKKINMFPTFQNYIPTLNQRRFHFLMTTLTRSQFLAPG